MRRRSAGRTRIELSSSFQGKLECRHPAKLKSPVIPAKAGIPVIPAKAGISVIPAKAGIHFAVALPLPCRCLGRYFSARLSPRKKNPKEKCSSNIQQSPHSTSRKKATLPARPADRTTASRPGKHRPLSTDFALFHPGEILANTAAAHATPTSQRLVHAVIHKLVHRRCAQPLVKT